MKKPVLYVLIILLSFCSCSSKDESKEAECNYKPAGWDYPIRPGMKEWYELSTDKLYATFQIPEEVLDTLSPEDAVRLFITFPYLDNVSFSQSGVAFYMMSAYNIISHLLSRNDVGGLLIAAYKDAGESGFKTLPYCTNKLWSFACMLNWFQMLLSQKEIAQNMTFDERLELIIEARSKNTHYDHNIMANILNVEEYPEFMASPYREVILEYMYGEYGAWWSYGIAIPYDEIKKMTDNYINDNKK